MEMIERLAFYGVRVVIPIYIAQADEPGGLHFTQIDKGTIFLWWAVVQSLVPMFSGGFADRYGYKKTIAASVTIKIIGYLLMATQRDFLPFLIGCCVLAFGTAIFKPGVQGTMGRCLTKDNSAVGWGAFYMLVNIGGFLGPPLAHFMYGISWAAVFYGCAAIVSLNYLMLFTYKEVPSGTTDGGPMRVFVTTFRNLWNLRLLLFIAIMSGFWLVLMQLFDMLPNFIVDWIDSSTLVTTFHLPEWMLQQNSLRGPQIAQEWLINANGGLIVVSMLLVAYLFSRIPRVASISLGTLIGSVGLMLAGFFTSGTLCLMGIAVFTLGEMLASPKMNEYLAVIAPPGQSGLYQGYSQIPVAIGWGYGSFLGGQTYDQLGDKANLALNYLRDNYQILDVPRTTAMQKLCEVTGKDYSTVTDLLWSTYHPGELWYRFAAIGVVSAIAMYFYGRWVARRFPASIASD